MRKYIDPVYLAVSEEAWRSRIYSEIFDSLTTILERIEDVEKSTDTLYKLVKFKASEGLFSKIYSNNPFNNNPEVQDFYIKLFKDRIIPELYRRFEWCPSFCIPSNQSSQIDQNIQSCNFSNTLVPEDVLLEWNHLVEQCLYCNNSNELLCLISPFSNQTKLENENSFLAEKLRVTFDVDELFDVSDFLDESILSKSNLRENCLKKAIEIYYNQCVMRGEWTSNLQPQDHAFDDFFWKSIEQAKLVDESHDYKERFVSSMAQVVYDLDIDIRKHKYKSDKILVARKKYAKYSADVFKMGQGTIDSRCSRIFYCKVSQQLYFYEFEPDRHKGE